MNEQITPEQAKLLEMFVGDEPLDPTLAACIGTSQLGTQCIKHPLLVDLFYTPTLHTHYNRVFHGKRQALAEAEVNADWYTYVFLHEKPWRREALVEVAHHMTDQQYWAIVGEVWKLTEFPSEELAEWIEVFESDRPGREAMTDPDDQPEWRALPPLITVYRGVMNRTDADGEPTLGLSWTLDYDQAVWFATRLATDDDKPGVWTAYVLRSDTIAYLGGRGEREVVCLPHKPSLVRWERVRP